MKSLSPYFGLIVLLFLFGCNAEEVEQLRTENEQLKAALGESNAFADEMNDKLGKVDVLLDSIERAEETLALTLMEGTSYENYADRLRHVQDYIENSKEEIEKLEQALEKSNTSNRVFLSQIRRLKEAVADREQRMVELSNNVEEYKKENASLIKTVDLQEQEIIAKESRIKAKKKEMALLEIRLERLRAEAVKAQADAYFAQGEMQEQLAQKTRLAPNKKKGHLQKAYDFYKQAFEAGREDAYDRMQELEGEF